MPVKVEDPPPGENVFGVTQLLNFDNMPGNLDSYAEWVDVGIQIEIVAHNPLQVINLSERLINLIAVQNAMQKHCVLTRFVGMIGPRDVDNSTKKTGVVEPGTSSPSSNNTTEPY